MGGREMNFRYSTQTVGRTIYIATSASFILTFAEQSVLLISPLGMNHSTETDSIQMKYLSGHKYPQLYID